MQGGDANDSGRGSNQLLDLKFPKTSQRNDIVFELLCTRSMTNNRGVGNCRTFRVAGTSEKWSGREIKLVWWCGEGGEATNYALDSKTSIIELGAMGGLERRR